jgi:hypothetical protein
MLEEEEVDEDDRPDEQLEDHQELALLDQVRLAGLVDQLRDLEHRRMHGHVLEGRVHHQPEAQAQRRDDQADHQQRAAVGPVEEIDRAEVGKLQVGLASLDGERRNRSQDRNRQHDDGNEGHQPSEPLAREHLHLSPRLA